MSRNTMLYPEPGGEVPSLRPLAETSHRRHSMGKGRPILAVFAVLLVMPATVASQEEQESVMPPHSVVAGKTLQEWSAIWWKWALAIPVTDNPLFDTSGANSKFGDVGPVFFLAGALAKFGSPFPGPVTRSVTIPTNKFIFFPIANAWDDNVGNGCAVPTTTPCAGRLTIDQLFTQLAGLFTVTALHASIDYKPVGGLFAHRETAPAFSYTAQITDNVAEALFGYAGADAPGTIFPAVADGYYLMLSPLPVGQHTINFGGTVSGASSDITYHVTVTAKPSPQPAVLIP
jgi:hypothetical protein